MNKNRVKLELHCVRYSHPSLLKSTEKPSFLAVLVKIASMPSMPRIRPEKKLFRLWLGNQHAKAFWEDSVNNCGNILDEQTINFYTVIALPSIIFEKHKK